MIENKDQCCHKTSYIDFTRPNKVIRTSIQILARCPEKEKIFKEQLYSITNCLIPTLNPLTQWL